MVIPVVMSKAGYELAPPLRHTATKMEQPKQMAQIPLPLPSMSSPLTTLLKVGALVFEGSLGLETLGNITLGRN